MTSLRLDKFLWFSRLAKTRAVAQDIAERGRVRIDGRPVDQAHAPVRIGSIVAFALHGRVRIVRVESLPPRRIGPPQVPQVYTDLSPKGENDLHQEAIG